MQTLSNSSLCDPNTLAGPSTPTRTSCGGNCCARCRGCFDHFISRHLYLSQGAAPSQEPSDVKVLEVPSRDISLQNFTQWQTGRRDGLAWAEPLCCTTICRGRYFLVNTLTPDHLLHPLESCT